MCNAYNKVSMETAENKTIGDYKYKVIIDAGHGGEDGGTQASDGTIEKDINLSIAQILRDMLIQGGFEVEMIREEDVSVGDNSLETVRERKRSDLEKEWRYIIRTKTILYLVFTRTIFQKANITAHRYFTAITQKVRSFPNIYAKRLLDWFSLIMKGNASRLTTVYSYCATQKYLL